MYRSVFFLLVVVVSCTYSSVVLRHLPELDGRIVGGEDAKIEDFPYQVAVFYRISFVCGGCMIRPNTILTAAHCLYGSEDPTIFSVQAGVTNMGGNNNKYGVEKVKMHEKYNPKTIDNDIAMLILSSDIEFSAFAKPIHLASESPAPGTLAVVTGWGETKKKNNRAVSPVLQVVGVEIVDQDTCKEAYLQRRVLITPRMLCAGVVGGGKDACQGDSGGPLVANGKLVGIVSFGVGCGLPSFPGVYTNVAAQRNWIIDNLPKS